MNSFIPVNQPLIRAREKELVMDCLNTGWISSEGPYVHQFEDAFSKRVGRNHGIACSNGTAALDIAIAALKLGPGDEVIMPTFTIISCAAALVRAGAVPVLVDADPQTWNMDPSQVRSVITERTAAILVVHIYGLPVDLDPILDIAEQKHLAIIEDAAELIGGTYKNKPCGSFGTVSTFSFYPNKHITTGEGGMVVTDDSYLADRCRSLRNLCFQPKKRFIHDELGWNYRMTNMQAALGLAQLDFLDENLTLKKSMGRTYSDAFTFFESIQLPLLSTDYADNLFWVYGLIVDESYGTAQDVMQSLSELGIGTRPFFYPMHKQPVFQSIDSFKNVFAPVSERIAQQGFYIPSGLGLSSEQQQHVIHSLVSILNG